MKILLGIGVLIGLLGGYFVGYEAGSSAAKGAIYAELRSGSVDFGKQLVGGVVAEATTVLVLPGQDPVEVVREHLAQQERIGMMVNP